MRLNPFFTETEWLPRLDHFWLGQPLLNDRLTWYEHSNVGLRAVQDAPSRRPIRPQAAHWGPLPWEAPADSTRRRAAGHAAGDRPAVLARRR